jgi:hypothetical protein
MIKASSAQVTLRIHDFADALGATPVGSRASTGRTTIGTPGPVDAARRP